MVSTLPVRRGEVYWADLPSPAGRRPVLVLTRDATLRVLNKVTVAPLTSMIRGLDSELVVGGAEGVPKPSVVSLDNILTVPRQLLDGDALGALGAERIPELDRALRYALQIRY